MPSRRSSSDSVGAAVAVQHPATSPPSSHRSFPVGRSAAPSPPHPSATHPPSPASFPPNTILAALSSVIPAAPTATTPHHLPHPLPPTHTSSLHARPPSRLPASTHRERNIPEIEIMYEQSFPRLSDRYFKQAPWPVVQAVEDLVDQDHVFCLLYKVCKKGFLGCSRSGSQWFWQWFGATAVGCGECHTRWGGGQGYSKQWRTRTTSSACKLGWGWAEGIEQRNSITS
jgi:hypothetical protein